VLALIPDIVVQAAELLELAIGENGVSAAVLSLPGFFIQNVGFAVAVLYVLVRVAPEHVEAASEGMSGAAVATA
jgi:hypothetical protein